jgi:hypothetical protein
MSLRIRIESLNAISRHKNTGPAIHLFTNADEIKVRD